MPRTEYVPGWFFPLVVLHGVAMIGVRLVILALPMVIERRLFIICADTWGAADVRAAIAALPSWIDCVGWIGPGVRLDEWIITGHSNGGKLAFL